MKDVQKLLAPYKNILISVAILAFSLLGLFIGVIPSFKTTLKLYQDNVDLEKEVNALSEKTELLNSLSEQDLRSKLSLLTSAVPSEKQIPSLFDSIESVVSRSNVSLEDMSLDTNQAISSESGKKQEKQEKNIGAPLISFNITVKGTYTELRSFLHEIISVRRFFRVRFFDITIQNSESVMLRLGADTFYYSLPTTIPSVVAKIHPITSQDEEVLKKVSAYPWVAEEVSSPLSPTVYEPKINPFAQ